MSAWVIFSCSIDGDSWLAFDEKAVCGSVEAAIRWIDAHPLTIDPTRPPAHHAMVAPHWFYFGKRVDLDPNHGDYGYVVEEAEVV